MSPDEAAAILGLDVSAPAEDITCAWRELAQMLHPDRYGANAKLRARAERQMAQVNEARDVLLGKARARGTRTSPRAEAECPEAIAHEADLRARVAEAARISVVTQARTMRERRAGYIRMVAVGAIAMLVCSRLRGTVGALGFSISSMLVAWGAVDIVTLGNQIRVLDARSAELIGVRDAARRIAVEAREL